MDKPIIIFLVCLIPVQVLAQAFPSTGLAPQIREQERQNRQREEQFWRDQILQELQNLNRNQPWQQLEDNRRWDQFMNEWKRQSEEQRWRDLQELNNQAQRAYNSAQENWRTLWQDSVRMHREMQAKIMKGLDIWYMAQGRNKKLYQFTDDQYSEAIKLSNLEPSYENIRAIAYALDLLATALRVGIMAEEQTIQINRFTKSLLTEVADMNAQIRQLGTPFNQLLYEPQRPWDMLHYDKLSEITKTFYSTLFPSFEKTGFKGKSDVTLDIDTMPPALALAILRGMREGLESSQPKQQ